MRYSTPEMIPHSGLTPAELRTLRSLKKPDQLQRFLDEEIAYNTEPDGPSCFSPRLVLRHTRGHCMEGALLAAAAFRVNGARALLLDLEAVRDDDHVLALYQVDGCWGAVAKSNYSGLRYREPVYRTLRELVLSYFPHYFNLQGERTLRAYSTRPIDLARFDSRQWMADEEPVWYIAEHLCWVPHTKIITPKQIRRLTRMDQRLFDAGLVGSIAH